MSVLARMRRSASARLCALVPVLSLAFAPTPSQARLAPEIVDLYDGRVQAVEDVISSVRGDLNPLHLDLDALSAHLDDDPAAFAAYVAEAVIYAPYAGTMHGAEGTMATKTGNALDQSLLLGALNTNAGYEARIARGDLSDADADRLLARWMAGGAPDFDIFAPGSPTAARIGTPAPSMAEPEAETMRPGDAVLTAAAAAGIDLSPVADRDALRETARGYFWVQYRETPFAEWEDAHPAFGNDAAPVVEPSAYISGSIPADLLNTVTVAAFVERRIGDTVERVRIMGDWMRPVSNLDGGLHSVAILPLDPPDGRDFEGATIFAPFFDGLRPDGAQMFDENGVILDMDLLDLGAPGSMLELFQTFADRTGAAVATLDGLDFGAPEEDGTATEPAGHDLLRVIVTLETTGPNGTSRHERALFDRTGEGAALRPWDQISKSAELYRHYAFTVESGYVAPTRTMDRVLDDTARRMAMFRAQLTLPGDDPSPAEIARVMAIAGDDPAAPGMLHRLRPTMIGAPATLPGGPRHAPVRPSILGMAGSPFPVVAETGASVALDLVNIGWGAWRMDADGEPMRDREAMAVFGAERTWLEAQAIDDLAEAANSDGEVRSAWAALAGAQGFALAGDAASPALGADVKAGRLAAVATGDAAAWWSFDPATGAAIGRTPGGGSGELVEYLVGLISVSMAVLFARAGVQGCEGAAHPDCCVGAALGIGLVVGGLFGVGIALVASEVALAGTAAAVAGAQGAVTLTFEFVLSAVMTLLPGDLGLCDLPDFIERWRPR